MDWDINGQASSLMLHLPRLGPSHYWALLQQYGSAAAAVAAPAQELKGFIGPEARRLLGEYQQNPDSSALGQQLLRDFDYCQQQGIHLLHGQHPNYPPLLSEIDLAPMVLFVRGEVSCLLKPQIGVVGSRNASPVGLDHSSRFSQQLAKAGVVINSGMALGIDGAAHRGALVGGGQTVAVMGTGIDTLYPRQHRSLADEIIATGGALVSELPLGSKPRPSNFPKRNRIISGLSMGVLVVEAAIRSGSLITARLAMEQNREVFAIPGSIHSPVSRGCHQLIKQGATLVEDVGDIIEQLKGQLAFQFEQLSGQDSRENKVATTADQQRLLTTLGYEPCQLDDLLARSQWPLSQISEVLLQLELLGLVECQGGLYFRRDS